MLLVGRPILQAPDPAEAASQLAAVARVPVVGLIHVAVDVRAADRQRAEHHAMRGEHHRESHRDTRAPCAHARAKPIELSDERLSLEDGDREHEAQARHERANGIARPNRHAEEPCVDAARERDGNAPGEEQHGNAQQRGAHSRTPRQRSLLSVAACPAVATARQGTPSS